MNTFKATAQNTFTGHLNNGYEFDTNKDLKIVNAFCALYICLRIHCH